MASDSPVTPIPVQPVSGAWRERLAAIFIRLGMVFGLAALVPAVMDAYSQREFGQIAIFLLVYLAAVAVAVLPVPFRVRASVTIAVIYALGVAALFENGLRGAASVYLLAFTIMTLLLFGINSSLAAFAAGLVSIITVSVLMIAGVVSPSNTESVRPTWLALIDAVATFCLVNIPVVVGINLFQREYAVTQTRERAAMTDLERERAKLEERVAERTRVVERRTIQIATGAEIARAAGAQLDPAKLLEEAVDLVQNRFDLYYVGAFLSDEVGKFAVLRAGTGNAGKTMLANNHRLEIGGQSMIGQAVAQGRARIALDVGREAVRFSNPNLPRTRSEMALPFAARGRTFGALTIQSEQPSAFSPEDIVALQSMADLIAIALDNARLFQEAQTALAEVTNLHQSYISQAWADYVESEQAAPTFIAEKDSFSRGQAVEIPNFEQAAREQKAVPGTGGLGHALTVPIRLRDQVIGAIAIEGDEEERTWSPDELALIDSVLEQTALSLETARLQRATENALSETRRLVNREQAVNEISGKLRRLPNVESVLTTALVELGRTLGASRGRVRLGGPGRGARQLEDSHE